MPIDGTFRSIFIRVALLGALASTACMWDGDVVVDGEPSELVARLRNFPIHFQHLDCEG